MKYRIFNHSGQFYCLSFLTITGESVDDDPKSPEVAATDLCLKESEQQTEPMKRKSWQFLISSNKRTKRKRFPFVVAQVQSRRQSYIRKTSSFDAFQS